MIASENYTYNPDSNYKPKKDMGDSKPRKSTFKLVRKPYFAFSFIAMLAVLGASVYLTGQNQDIRQKASDDEPLKNIADITVNQDIGNVKANSENSIKIELDNLGGTSTDKSIYPDSTKSTETFILKAVLLGSGDVGPVTLSNFDEIYSKSYTIAELNNVKPLGGNEKRNEEIDFNVSVSKYNRICVFADSSDTVMEVDEENNVVCLNY